ncbi:MAG: cyclic nucleotide-binding domain-containing protein [Acidobacteriota bacterium]
MTKPVFKSTRSKTTDQYMLTVEDGDAIFLEGDLGTEMYVIQEGHVALSRKVGDEQRQLAVLEPGDFFGEMSILEDLPRSATARASGDCRLLQINGSTFDHMLRKNPEIAVRMMRKLSRRLRETNRLLREALGGVDQLPSPEMPPPETGARHTGTELLEHDSGVKLYLSAGDETTVGRRDPVTGIHPDIDLTDIDDQRSISRRHSKIFRRGGKFYVREEIGTMNGTFVNGDRVETGVPVEFEDKDELRFGLVKLIFHGL